MNTCLREIFNRAILSLLVVFTFCQVAEGGPFSGSSANVGEDWTNSNKSITTSGNVTAHDVTSTGKITPSTEGVKYNQGDPNAVNTTMEAKLQVQLLADTDYTSLALAISNIGSTTPTKLMICRDNVIADGTTITVTDNILLDFTCGGSIDGVAGGGTETFVARTFITGTDHQIFGDNLGTITISDPGLVRDPRWFGAVVDMVTSDIVSWQKAFASFTTRGGSLYAPDKSYLGNAAGVQIIWPNDGTNCYPISIIGSNELPVLGVFSTFGMNQVKYGGAGTLFDCRNGDGSTLNWMGSIKGVAFTGTNPATAGSYGLYVYDMTKGSIKNTVFFGFETGVYVARYMYFSVIENCVFAFCQDGFYVNSTGSSANGVTFDKCRFSENTRYGLRIVYGGESVILNGCYIEKNGSYGLVVSNIVSLLTIGGYFENNNTNNPQVLFSSSPFYNSTVTMISPHFSASITRESLYLDSVAHLNIFGGELLSYGLSGYAIKTTGYNPKGSILGVKWPKADTQLMNRSIRDGFLISGQQMPTVKSSFNSGKFDIAQTVGDVLINSFDPDSTNHGNVFGWVTTEPGAGSSTTPLAGVTATTVLGDATITFNAAPDVIYQGATIEVTGETFEGDSYATVVGFTATAVAELDKTADVGVAGAAVAYHAAVQKNVYGVQFDRRTSSTPVATSGTDETTLATYPVAGNTMGTKGGVRLIAFGTKTTATNNKTFKIYFGATSATVYVANDILDWRVEAEVFNTGATNAQYIYWKFISPAAIATDFVPTFSVIDTTADVVFKLTAQCTSASDHVDLYNYRFDPI